MTNARLPLTVALSVAFAAPAAADDGVRNARSTVKPVYRGSDHIRPRTDSRVTTPTALESLREEVEAIWAGRDLRRGTTAVYVVDAETGAELHSVHADEKLNPASNVKLVSTATVLDLLGPDWRFRTRLLGPVPDHAGTVDGSVYLRGNYDPTIGIGALGHMAREAHAVGVRRITGDVVLSDDLRRDTIATGTVKVVVRGDSAGSRPEVEVSPMSDLIRVENHAVTRRRGRNRVRVRTRMVDEADGPVLVVEVRGRIRAGRSRTYRRNVYRRSTFTGYTLRAALREVGIAVDGQVRIADLDDYVSEVSDAGGLPVELAVNESRPISYLVSRVNKRSLNHLADRLVMTAAAQTYGGEPTMDKAITAMGSWLEGVGIDPDNLVIDTGSGLSYKTELSARQIVRVLRAAGGYRDGAASPDAFRHSLAVGGVDGTLRRRFRRSPAQGLVHAKTGTLTSVIALSGFVQADDGRTLCFSIVTNGNRHRRRQRVRREHEVMVEALYSFLETTDGAPIVSPDADSALAADGSRAPRTSDPADAPAPLALSADDLEIEAEAALQIGGDREEAVLGPEEDTEPNADDEGDANRADEGDAEVREDLDEPAGC